ncbi:MAG: glycosyltransferase family 4 protein [Verrucomicrobiota bacterium]
MKQLLFIRRRWSQKGGAENYLRRVARALKTKEYQLSLLCESWGSDDNNFEHIHHIQKSNNPDLFASYANAYIENLKPKPFIFSLERGITCDIYRAGDGVHAAWLNRRAKYSSWRAKISNVINPKNRKVKKLENFTLNSTHTRHIMANSKMVRDDIIKHSVFPKKNISILYNAIDIETFTGGNREKGRNSLGLTEKEYVILLVGHGPERKGHKLAKSMVQLSKTLAKLIIVDTSPSCPMPDLYAAADVFLFPSLYDPFPSVVLEAMASGLPVITTYETGASEIIHQGHNGFMLDSPTNISQGANFIAELTNVKLRKAIGLAAQQTATHYNMPEHIEKLIDHINTTAKCAPS